MKVKLFFLILGLFFIQTSSHAEYVISGNVHTTCLKWVDEARNCGRGGCSGRPAQICVEYQSVRLAEPKDLEVIKDTILANITNLGTELKSEIVKKLIQDDPEIQNLIKNIVIQELIRQKKSAKTTEEESSE